MAAILIYKGKVLAFKRPHHSTKSFISSKYEFPGGKIKDKESEIFALKRELKEELEINIESFIKYFESTYHYPDFEVNIKFYLARIENLRFKLKAHTEYKLLEIQNLKTLDWLQADYKVIRKLELYGFSDYLI